MKIFNKNNKGQIQFILGWIPVLIVIIAILLIFGGTVFFLSANLLKLIGATLAVMGVYAYVKTQNMMMLIFIMLVAVALIFLPFNNSLTIAKVLGRT